MLRKSWYPSLASTAHIRFAVLVECAACWSNIESTPALSSGLLLVSYVSVVLGGVVSTKYIGRVPPDSNLKHLPDNFQCDPVKLIYNTVVWRNILSLVESRGGPLHSVAISPRG